MREEVVINIDDVGYLQAISVQSTPFNTPLEWCSVQSARARVGLPVHLWVQKWEKLIFSKGASRPIGVLKHLISGHT